MEHVFKVSETVAARSRIFLEIVASSDGSALTGQTGTGFITKTGVSLAATTNSLVEVDNVNNPGLYYIQLTPTELNTLGIVIVGYKSGSSKQARSAGIIVPYDPYTVDKTGFVQDPSDKTGYSLNPADKTGFALASNGMNQILGYHPGGDA